MPLHEYRCPDGHVTELLTGTLPPDVTDCRAAVPCWWPGHWPDVEVSPIGPTRVCGLEARRIMSAPALPRDGTYSHRATAHTPETSP